MLSADPVCEGGKLEEGDTGMNLHAHALIMNGSCVGESFLIFLSRMRSCMMTKHFKK